ncbi:carboxymuconolactone decarboxylase family protein [Thalassospira australica]|uniref:carboxymuconolactone decarboxylase family protein n=1 Tax=Thalassospira australica TaxID=1528106 RepID=UPI00384C9B07
MSRISYPAIETATGPAAEVFAQVKKAAGSVPNAYATIGSLAPDILKTILNAEGVLASATLSKQDRETIKLVVSEVAGCDYCVAAHSFLGKLAGIAPDTLSDIRNGTPTGDPKRDALIGFVRALQQSNGTVAEADFNAIKAAGYSDAQLVEISLAISLITFTNIFNRINDTVVDFPSID